MALYFAGYNLVFHHYPRTGGTSLRSALGHECIEYPRSHSPVSEWKRALEALKPTTCYELSFVQGVTKARHCSFVRNPFDLVLSLRENRKRANKPDGSLSLEKFILSGFVDRVLRNDPSYAETGFAWTSQSQHLEGLNTGLIVRFEDGSSGWDKLFDWMGMKPPSRPHEGGSRPPSARSVYDAQSTELVRTIFKEDFKRWGYGLDPVERSS